MSEPLTSAQEMLQRYRNVFGSSEGRIVLGDIMSMGHYFETINPNDPIMAAEHNMAEVIARMAGLFNPLYAQLGLGSEKEK